MNKIVNKAPCTWIISCKLISSHQNHKPYLHVCLLVGSRGWVAVGMENLDVLIRSLPSPAWRLLFEMLRCDRGFCQAVVPYFHAGGCVTLYISRKPLHVLRGMPAAASEPHESEPNVNSTFVRNV